jgi:hypothetical protein
MSEAAVKERSGPEQSRLSHMLNDFQEWRITKGLGTNFKANFVQDEDAFEITLGDALPTVYVYLSDIDAEFYHEHAAVFAECQVGGVGEDTDLGRYLRFAASEMVLSRLSLRTDEEEPLLVVEGAIPYQLVRFEMLELLIQEVAAIGADLIDLAEGRIEESSEA